MSKKTLVASGAILSVLILVLVPIVACLALVLVLLPTMAFTVSAHNTPIDMSTTKASYAFTALITKGEDVGRAITGGLGLSIHNDSGALSGSFHAPESAPVPVSGQISGSQINISFHDTASDRVIKGTGTISSSGEYLGTFFIADQQHQLASGVWSGLPVAKPGNVLAFALRSVITQGPDKGTVFTAAVVIDRKTLTGTFSGPNGDLANVTVTFKDGGETIIASYANGQFIDVGHLVGDSDGYIGTVTVTGTADKGHWSGYFFTF